ncbi:serine/threonine protein kinase [Streptomyces acidiscabies]|uniref:non-specific serine/threonine protein kinase n=4 Tax=Streptomyces acidiscabies TaxID=42234 RepID=A0AAP6BE10_9ACTN|nr:serine/threonine-protein kinase [Streptomyces acidiscabies]MBZ3910789.1 serine/threonine protein kinase [Streptomyces acidiscabies]MDX2963029.1 serine/threonine-protein kinase [Streptomyces acidiscabies]MDX3017425.1 serine/threonine-protein kinase [Streptomyces acidiscabies]MDX3787901.1 serine/threonine-protein kinase [Streptomyces acidiscabies]
MVAGRYRLVESIGQGGMGRVWRAADEILDRLVAVKEIRIDGTDAEDTRTRRERTLREARATARIDHPNVVRVYDVVDEGELLWIVMELVRGRSLERITVEDGPLGPVAAARVGLGLVAALQRVHARGVLHRDIKPGNVLVEGDGDRVVLTDFGIAAIQDAKALTMVGMLVGSPDYMAPERISGRPQGPPSDIWSVGATLCAALAGHSPFARDTTMATLHAVLYEEPRLPDGAGELGGVLERLLAKEPEGRPDLAELETELRRVAFPEPTPTVRVGFEPGYGEAPQATHTPQAIQPPQAMQAPQAAQAPQVPQPPQPTQLPYASQLAQAEPAQAELPPPPSPHPDLATTPPPPPDLTTTPFSRPPRTPPSPFPPPPTTPQDPPRHRRTTAFAAAGVAAVAAIIVTAVLLTSGGGADNEATGATTTPAPTPTVEGTTHPRTPPPGTHEEAGGYAWKTPAGWRRDVKTGAEVHYTSPDGTQELLAKSALARGTLIDSWRKSEQDAHRGQNYRKLRLEETEFRGNPAVVWEYTFTLKGTPWHARLLGFDQDGKSFQVNTWYQPGVEESALKVYEEVKTSFTVL